ncbi:hypothetical protein ACWHA1_39740, partial [Streptomyces decoyicus]
MEDDQAQVLDLADIHGTVLRQRLSPYTGAYFLLRIDDPADGRRMLRRLTPQAATAANWWAPGASLAERGPEPFRAACPARSRVILENFPAEFHEGMALKGFV